MKILLSIAVLFSLCALALLGERTIDRASAAQNIPAAPARFEKVGQARGTDVYALHYEGYTCFVASTDGGSGISINCPK